MANFVSICLFLFVLIEINRADSQKSSKWNLDSSESPFRMQKNNLLWQKAQTRLADGKLKTLFKELKDQDKDEIALKKSKSEGQDKGSRSAEVKRRFALLLSRYNLQDAVQTESDDESNLTYELSSESSNFHKQIFKDKKLDRLWNKVEQQQFTDEELRLLKEEFQKYQSKLDDYHLQIEKVNELENKIKDELERRRNSIDSGAEFSSDHLINLKEKHREIKRQFNQLEDQVLSKSKANKDVHFDEPRVSKLWKLALKVGFSEEELSDLREELQHFESRLKKIAYLEEHYEIGEESVKRLANDKHVDHEESKHIRSRLSELTNHASKLERDLESKILSKHVEL